MPGLSSIQDRSWPISDVVCCTATIRFGGVSILLFDLIPYLLVALTAFGASVVGGVAGYGTGLLLPPVLVPIIGAEAVVPVIGLSALMTNASRLVAFRDDFDFKKARILTLTALPTTILGAYGYSLLSGAGVAILIGVVLIVLVPVRRILTKRKHTLTERGIAVAGVGYGVLNGGTAGSGVVLLSILMGAGLSGTAVIATDAGISLVVGIAKSATFFARGLLPIDMVLMSLLVGISAVPGAFLAKKMALKLSGQAHILLLDAVVVLGGLLLISKGAGI